MAEAGLWIIDPTTNESRFMYYSELEESTLEQLIKPIGGFCWRADEFVQLRMPPAPFYVKDWLPKQGKAEIYAPAKSGKSFLAVQMARCIGSSEEFLGIPTTQGTVLYCQSELGEGVLQARIQSTGKSYPNIYVGTTFSMKLDTEGGQRMILKALDAIEPNVLILDPLYKIMKGDENESKDMSVIIDFLDEVIKVYNCSILVIHHPGKDIKKGGRGSTVLEDWVDSAIEMKKTSKKSEPLKVKLTPKLLRHATLPPEPIEVEMKDFEFEPIGETISTITQKVEEIIIKSKEPVSPKILFALGIGSNASVHNSLKKLEKEGIIEKIGWGKYQRRDK